MQHMTGRCKQYMHGGEQLKSVKKKTNAHKALECD